MTETVKAPRKRAVKKPVTIDDVLMREHVLSRPKPGAIHPDARVITADGKRKRLTALDKARLIITRSQAPVYAVRGRFAGWLLSTISPLALVTASGEAFGNVALRVQHAFAGRHCQRPRFYSLHHGKNRNVRLAK